MGGCLLAAWPWYQPGPIADGDQAVRGHGAAPGAVGRKRQPRHWLEPGPVTSTDVQTELQLVTSAQVQSQVRARARQRARGLRLGGGPDQRDRGDRRQPRACARRADSQRLRQRLRLLVDRDLDQQPDRGRRPADQADQRHRQGDRQASLPAPPRSSAALSNQQAVLKGQLAQLQVAGATASTGLELVTPATVPTSPSSPKPARGRAARADRGAHPRHRRRVPARQPGRHPDRRRGGGAGGRSASARDGADGGLVAEEARTPW